LSKQSHMDPKEIATKHDSAASPTSSKKRDDPSGAFVLPARVVGIASGLGAVACLAALVVVASVKGADALSTVALALAVLAFAIQIIVFIADAHAARSQMLRSEEINSDTRTLLTDLRATALSTQAMVGEQFSQLLSAFMSAASTTAKESGKLDPDELERRLMENVRREFGARSPSLIPSAPSSLTTSWTRRDEAPEGTQGGAPRAPDADATASIMRTFPDASEGVAALDVLRGLPPEDRARLARLAHDDLNSRELGFYLGLRLGSIGETDNLTSRGLAEIERREDQVLVRLTDSGRAAGRLFTAQGVLPEWMNEPGVSDLLVAADEGPY
jgi:hypothetical protein